MSHEEGDDKPQGPDRRESIVATVGDDAILYLQLMNFEDGERVEVMVTPAAARSSVAGNETPGRIPDLEGARINASYWLNEANHKYEERRGDPLMCAEQAINAWKNAAYAMADQRDAARSATAEDVRRLEWLFSKLNDTEIKAKVDLVSDAHAAGGLLGIRMGDWRAAIDAAVKREAGDAEPSREYVPPSSQVKS